MSEFCCNLLKMQGTQWESSNVVKQNRTLFQSFRQQAKWINNINSVILQSQILKTSESRNNINLSLCKQSRPPAHHNFDQWLIPNYFFSPQRKSTVHKGINLLPVHSFFFFISHSKVYLSSSRVIELFPLGNSGRKLTSDFLGFIFRTLTPMLSSSYCSQRAPKIQQCASSA